MHHPVNSMVAHDHDLPNVGSASSGWQKCWTHSIDVHDFFISYRVSSEGKKSPGSPQVWKQIIH